MYLWIVVLALTGLLSAEKASYNGYRVYRLQPHTTQQTGALKGLKEANQVSFWTEVNTAGLPVDVLVAPHQRAMFAEFLEDHDIPHNVAIDNVQELINSPTSKVRNAGLEWSDYHDLDELYQWLDDLERNYSNVRVVVGGRSYENRDIKGIEIINGEDLPGLVMESGMHAREWIAPAVTSWIINEILQSKSDSIFKQFNYLYFPNVNPDGYVYSWTTDRFWRKTRKPYFNGLFNCYGADPNRNFDNHWMEGGSSPYPCSEDFAGSEPFSEPEIKSLTDYLKNTSRRYDLYFSFHSYSQILMFPWGYTSEPAALHDLWQRIGEKAAVSLEAVHGTKFQVGSIYEILYITTGSSAEWYYAEFNSTITFAYEARDTGRYGFLLPPDQIIPCAEEHLASLQTVLEEYKAL